MKSFVYIRLELQNVIRFIIRLSFLFLQDEAVVPDGGRTAYAHFLLNLTVALALMEQMEKAVLVLSQTGQLLIHSNQIAEHRFM